MAQTADIAKAAAAIRALDFRKENERIAALRAERQELEAARTKAEQRSAEITNILASSHVHDGRAVADALIAGQSAVPHEGIEALREEQQALAAGRRELSERIRDVVRKIDDTQSAAARQVVEALMPLSESLLEEAAAGAKTVLEAYACIRALCNVTNRNVPSVFKAERAAKGLQGPESVLPYAKAIDLPRELVDALEPLTAKGDALKIWKVPTSVAV